MGRAGSAVNVLALLYTTWAFFWSFWPITYAPSLKMFNWAAVIFVGAVMIGCMEYFVHGRNQYKGPAVKVQNFQ